MPLYQYKAYASNGKTVKGSLTAESEEAAIATLKQKGLYPVWLGQQKKGKLSLRLQGIDRKGLSSFSTQLSVLLGAGVPLRDALRSLSEELQGQWKDMVTQLQEAVQEGASLSTAMSRLPEVFPDYYRAMIQASEQSGNLPEALVTLSEFLEIQQKTSSKITSSLLYPSFMIIVAIFVLSFVFSFVIPKMTRIFEASKTNLPFVTVILIKISTFMQSYWPLLFLLLALSVYGIFKFHRSRPEVLHGLLLKIPFLRSLYYSRFTGTLGFLLKGGVPIVKALELAGRACGNKVLLKKIRKAAEGVSEGGSLASSLEGISPVLKQLIHTGETSGTLAELMEKTSKAYYDEFTKAVDRALSLLEPLMVLIMGVVVGFIVFAVLLPIFQVNQLIRW